MNWWIWEAHARFDPHLPVFLKLTQEHTIFANLFFVLFFPSAGVAQFPHLTPSAA
jgi:hypothetical protein